MGHMLPRPTDSAGARLARSGVRLVAGSEIEPVAGIDGPDALSVLHNGAREPGGRVNQGAA